MSVEKLIKEYTEKRETSKRLFKRAKRVIPGGISHNIRYFPPYPFYVKKAKGAKIWDVDGNEYVDLWMGHYAHILGHSPEIIVNKIKNEIEGRIHWGLVNEYEVELAEILCEILPSAEKVRFCCSGTEATMYAVRLARAFTGKNLILKAEGGWHGGGTDLCVGIHKPYEESESSGLVPEIKKYTRTIPFNETEKAVRIIRENTRELAGIIVEPVAGAAFIPAELEFLKVLREEAKKWGALLIFDEVITGFRIALGGAQKKFGITPDLSTLGKILGGGIGIGAVAGRKDIMDLCDPTKKGEKWVLTGGGTFSCNPLSMFTALTIIKYLKENEEKIYPQLDKKGKRVRESLENIFKESKIPVKCTGCGSLFKINFPFQRGVSLKNPHDVDYLTDTDKRDKEFRLRMIIKGVHIYRGGGALSTAHTSEDIKKIISCSKEAIGEMERSNIM